MANKEEKNPHKPFFYSVFFCMCF